LAREAANQKEQIMGSRDKRGREKKKPKKKLTKPVSRPFDTGDRRQTCRATATDIPN
jgi:hypothetical protein